MTGSPIFDSRPGDVLVLRPCLRHGTPVPPKLYADVRCHKHVELAHGTHALVITQQGGLAYVLAGGRLGWVANFGVELLRK